VACVMYGCKKCVFSLLRKVDRQSLLRISIGSEFQTLGAATLNARLAVSVRVLGRTTAREERKREVGENATELVIEDRRRK